MKFCSESKFDLNQNHLIHNFKFTDPQSGKTSTPAALTPNTAAKRGIDKTHVPSPIKRAKTTVAKKNVLHE